jgi:hypothetical protein
MKLNFFYFPPKFWTILSLPSKELSSHRWTYTSMNSMQKCSKVYQVT